MKKFFCLSCDNVWNDLDYVCCPKCKSTDVLDDGDTDEPYDFGDGHYEGGFMRNNYFQDDSGE